MEYSLYHTHIERVSTIDVSVCHICRETPWSTASTICIGVCRRHCTVICTVSVIYIQCLSYIYSCFHICTHNDADV